MQRMNHSNLVEKLRNYRNPLCDACEGWLPRNAQDIKSGAVPVHPAAT